MPAKRKREGLADEELGRLTAAEAGEVESPRLAWVVWLVIVAATKSQPEIRIKTLSWPFLVLWLTAMAGGANLLQ